MGRVESERDGGKNRGGRVMERWGGVEVFVLNCQEIGSGLLVLNTCCIDLFVEIPPFPLSFPPPTRSNPIYISYRLSPSR